MQDMTDVPDTLDDPLATAETASMTGRRALVCGGGLSTTADGSVGFSSAWLLARHGARIAVFDRDRAAAQRTVERINAAGGEAFAVIGDATSEADCAHAVEQSVGRLGGLDTVVNSVAGADRDGIFDATPQRWEEIIRVNLTSAWLITRSVEPYLGEGSSVVHVSSSGAKTPGPGMPYSVAKAGLENLVLGAAATLGPRGIRVNAVQVGMIWSSFAARGMDQQMRERRRRAVCLQREGNVWDIGAAVLFLSSEQARWVSGHVLAVNGGGPYFGGGGVSASASSSSATAASAPRGG